MATEQRKMSRLDKEYLQKDRQYIIRTLPAPPNSADIVITEAHDIMVKDINGKEYMDLWSSWTTCSVGHCRKDVIEVAMAQMSKFDFSPITGGLITKESCDLAEKLAKTTPTGLNHFLFSTGGSEADDNTIKLSRIYWMYKGKPEKTKVISLSHSYHGCTMFMLPASGRESSPFSSPNNIHIPSPDCYRCVYGKTYPGCDLECAQALAQTIEREGEDHIAAFIAEPVMTIPHVVPPEGYWSRVRKICTDHNVLLIADEVMTGMGLTGKFWGCQAVNLIPDMMVTAKGLSGGYIPFGMAVVRDEIYQEGLLGNPNIIPGYTYTAHPVCCAVVSKLIDIMLGEKLVENAAKVGAHFQKRLAELKDITHVGNVGGIGLFGLIEFVKDKATKEPLEEETFNKLARRTRDNGLLHYSFGNMIRLLLPRIITKEQVDKAVDILKLSLKELPE